MKIIVLLTILLTGCATCREHPTACAIEIGAVVVAGAVIASSNQHSPVNQPNQQIRGWYTK